jgi:hypothetical protein
MNSADEAKPIILVCLDPDCRPDRMAVVKFLEQVMQPRVLTVVFDQCHALMSCRDFFADMLRQNRAYGASYGRVRFQSGIHGDLIESRSGGSLLLNIHAANVPSSRVDELPPLDLGGDFAFLIRREV